jgi:hypothetical protein
VGRRDENKAPANYFLSIKPPDARTAVVPFKRDPHIAQGDVPIGQSKGKSMTRSLRALLLALVAVFAMTAVLASATQAQIKVTTGASPAWLTGSQVGSHTFTVENGGPVLSCLVADFTATVTSGANAVTVVPRYTTCQAEIGAEVFKATLTMNDCDYLFHGGVEVSSTTFSEGEVDLKCPAGKGGIELHIYRELDESVELCTLTVAEQLNKKGTEFHNIAGIPNDLTLTSVVTVNMTRTGSLLCGKASNTAIYAGTTTLKAFEDAGGTISNGTVSGLVEGAQVSLTASK